MWTDEQLDSADYVAFVEEENGRQLNAGTIEMQGTAYQGPYLCTPMPPFGSLKNGDGVAPLGAHVRVPLKRYRTQRNPFSWPSPVKGETTIHQYGDGSA